MRSLLVLLMGSAAALVTQAASAADLPSRKAAPVEYVKVCSALGPAFFYIPGTDTCLRVGGRVRAEYRYREPRYTTPGDGRSQDAIGFRARGRLNVDTRTETSYGTLRAFLRYELTANTGVYGTNDSSLDQGYVQFAGLTAGRLQSFFDFYANDMNFNELAGSDTTLNVLAYTATFGTGFSATLSIEDNNARRTPFSNLAYAGSRAPDGVAVLRYDNDNGALAAAQLSGAVHQVNVTNQTVLGDSVDTEYGFAIQGGVQFRLPALAAGDVLWLQGAYAEGAVSYLGIPNIPNTLSTLNLSQGDGVVLGDNVKRTKGYALTAAFLHYWTPSVRQGIYSAYSSLDYPVLAASALGVVDTKIFQVGSSLIWTPVSDLDIGVEVFYNRLDPRGRIVSTRGSDDSVEGRLRVQRDF